MKITAIRTRIFREHDDLLGFIDAYVPSLGEGAVLAVTSKIVALAEGRVAPLTSEKARERLIKQESTWAMKTKYTWLTIKDGIVMAAAGIDESNADGKIILLPRDNFRSAVLIRRHLRARHGHKRLGVLITDSRLMPLRAGIVGVALGYAGFRGLCDLRGKPDIFGRAMKISRTDVADSLATAAVLVMGEAAEQQPLALIEDAPVEFCERVSRRELYIDPREDMYRPLFQNLGRHIL